MKLTQEQKTFLNEVCFGRKIGRKWKLNSDGKVDVEGSVDMKNKNLTEIPVKFGRVEGWFDCRFNYLTTLKNCPTYLGGIINCYDNNLKDYFKPIKEEDFKYWVNFNWLDILREYPFLINIMKNYIDIDALKYILDTYPQIKLYLE